MPSHFMRLRRLFNSSGFRSSLRRALPHPPEIAPFPPNTPFPKPPAYNSAARAFSSRPARPRVGIEYGARRGTLRTSSAATRPKSLIEDEAELSDWVSDIKKDSFRLGLSSDDDGDNVVSDRDPPRSSRGRGIGMGRGRGSGGRGMERERDRPPSFRNRASSSDDYLEGRRASQRKQLFSESEDEDGDEEDGDRFSSRQMRGRGRGGRGGVLSNSMRRGGRDFDSSYRQGGGARGSFQKRCLSSGSEEEEDEEEDRFASRQSRGRGGRGGVSSNSMRRGGRGFDSSYVSGGGARGSFQKRRLSSGLEEEEDEEEDRFASRQSRGRGGRVGVSSNSMRRGGRGFDSSYVSGGGARGSFQKRRLSSGSEEEEYKEEDRFASRQSRGRGGRGGVSSNSMRRGGRGFDSSYVSGGGARGSFPKKPIYSDSEEEEEVEEDRFSSRQTRGRGGRGGVSSISARKGGRDLNSSSKQAGGAGRSVLAISEDEDRTEDEDESDDDDDSASGFEDDLFGDKDDEQEESAKDAFESITSPEMAKAQPASRTPVGESDSYLSQTRFDQCSISPLSLKGIKAAGYERMTVVQEATLPVILKGKDVLARARTGTGKTVAFLLPAIEVVAKLPPVDRDQKRHPINVLVICPTRELAAQAATEAEALLKCHPSIGAQVVTGGTRLALEQKRMQANPCQILVATPGRLRDHIENTPGFATRLMGVKVLVLDEADRLLDMGFRKDIEKIVVAVPKQRQTLLFSATVPDEVRQVCYIAMKRDHEFINTVEEGSEETHSQVRQMHIVAPLEKHFPILYSILTEHISEDVDYKVIVFCTTAMVTKLVADLLSELKLNVREIHSRKPQTYRTRVSKEFKESKGLILVSSDVSARGVDYPNVTLVIQVGVPSDREQYVHRLGRTGRKGKEGKGILMLAPWEGFFLESIKDLPMTEAPLPPSDPDTRKRVERALAHVETKSKESAYQAWLGYYNSQKNVGRDKYKLVLLANEFSHSMGLDNPPAIPNIVLRKMGLNNVPGLRSSS